MMMDAVNRGYTARYNIDLWTALEQKLWTRLSTANAPVGGLSPQSLPIILGAGYTGVRQASAIHFSFWLSRDYLNRWCHGQTRIM